MAKPKYLKHRKTGAIFPYNEHLARRNRNVEPIFEDGSSPFEEVEVDTTSDAGGDEAQDQTAGEGTGGDEPLMVGETPIDEATKEQMCDFAQQAFGKKLDKRKNEDVLREELTALIRAAE